MYSAKSAKASSGWKKIDRRITDARRASRTQTHTMGIARIPILNWLLVSYGPSENDRSCLDRAETQTQSNVDVTVAVLDAKESQRFFGVHMARRGIQPVWLRIANRSGSPYRLSLLDVDPNYYSAHEAAAANHFSSGHRLWAFGLLVWVFLPLLLLLPIRMINVRRANRKMDAYFQRHAFRLHPIPPGQSVEGFVFTSLDAGNKVVHVRLMGHGEDIQCIFTVPIPGLKADYLRHDFEDRYPAQELVACDIPAL